MSESEQGQQWEDWAKLHGEQQRQVNDLQAQLTAANERAESLALIATDHYNKRTAAEAAITLLRPRAALGERYHRLLKAGGASHFHDGGIENCDLDCPERVRRSLDEQWDVLPAAPVQADTRGAEPAILESIPRTQEGSRLSGSGIETESTMTDPKAEQ